VGQEPAGRFERNSAGQLFHVVAGDNQPSLQPVYFAEAGLGDDHALQTVAR